MILSSVYHARVSAKVVFTSVYCVFIQRQHVTNRLEIIRGTMSTISERYQSNNLGSRNNERAHSLTISEVATVRTSLSSHVLACCLFRSFLVKLFYRFRFTYAYFPHLCLALIILSPSFSQGDQALPSITVPTIHRRLENVSIE